MSSSIPELSKVFLCRSAVGFVSLPFGVVGSDVSQPAVDFNPGNTPLAIYRHHYALWQNVGAPPSLVLLVLAARRFAQIAKPIIRPIVVAMIKSCGRFRTLHHDPDHPMREVSAVIQGDASVAFEARPVGPLPSKAGVPGGSVSCVAEVADWSSAPMQHAGPTIVTVALAQVGLRWQLAKSHWPAFSRSVVRAALEFPLRRGPHCITDNRGAVA